MINELLYKSDSNSAHDLMRKDPSTFEEVCFFLLRSHISFFPKAVHSLSITLVSATKCKHGPPTQLSTSRKQSPPLIRQLRPSLPISDVVTLLWPKLSLDKASRSSHSISFQIMNGSQRPTFAIRYLFQGRRKRTARKLWMFAFAP